MNNIKKLFPIFAKNPNLVFLDNASTTFKPQKVIDSILSYYTEYSANIGRGTYRISEIAEEKFEEARNKVASFLKTTSEEITFTFGATDSAGLLTSTLANSGLLNDKTRILTTILEHNSSLAPWQRYTKLINYLPLKNFDLDLTKFSEDIDIITFPLVSNVTGTRPNISQIKNLYPKALIFADATQAISHIDINLSANEIDGLYFSGHKFYSASGCGVLYLKKSLRNILKPAKIGGGNIFSMSKKASAVPNGKLEAGTPNIEGCISIGTAVDFVNQVGLEKIRETEEELCEYLVKELKNFKDISIYKPDYPTSVFSFNVNGIHPHDISYELALRDICVRSGKHCANLIHEDSLGSNSSVRISLGMYNTKEDIEKLLDKLTEVVKIFKS